MQVVLPQKGPMWFYIDNKTTVKQFTECLKAEDASIDSVQTKYYERSTEEDNLYQILNAQNNYGFFLEING